MLKVWNMLLVGLSFTLALFGTFLTRSGIITSIHAFGESTLGPFFLGFILVIVVGTLVLLFTRLDDLKSAHTLESYISREAVFLYNNLLLVGLAFAVFWGTMFPVLSEVATGQRITVGPPFFDQVALPIGVALLALTGLGPLIPWRRASRDRMVRALTVPLAVTVAGGIALLVFTDAWNSFWGGVVFTTCVFVTACIAGEFVRGVKVRHAAGGVSWPGALGSLINRNRRRYGGYIVHLGVVVLFVGLTGSSAFTTARDVNLAQGDSTTVAGYRFTSESFSRTANSHVRTVTLTMGVDDPSGKRIATLTPAKNLYLASLQPSTEVSLKSLPTRDLYVALIGLDQRGTAQLSIYVNPLVSWIWFSGLLIVIGSVIAVWPVRGRVRPITPARDEKPASVETPTA